MKFGRIILLCSTQYVTVVYIGLNICVCVCLVRLLLCALVFLCTCACHCQDMTGKLFCSGADCITLSVSFLLQNVIFHVQLLYCSNYFMLLCVFGFKYKALRALGVGQC